MILALFMRIPDLGKIAVVLSLLLAVIGITTRWGLAEALASAIAAGLFVEYVVVPPSGAALIALQHWIPISAFLITAVIISELSIRVRSREREARKGRRELENLCNFSRAIRESGCFRSTLSNVVGRTVAIFGVQSAAVYFKPLGETFRAGTPDAGISEDLLHSVAEGGDCRFDPDIPFAIAPLHLTRRPVGSLALRGGDLSRTAVQAIAQRIGTALETASALEDAARSEAARRGEELKSVALDALAHDLKTPLASIKAAATCLLAEQSDLPPSDLEMLCVINEETDRLNRIMNDAVEMARLEVGILELKKRQYSIRETVYAALEDLNSAAEGRQVLIDIPESLPPVDIDFCLVKQVFKQLLDNALKYSPKASPVVVTSACTRGGIAVSVADMGPGIPDEEKPRVFEKGYRGCEGCQRSPGTGMGLAIAKSIVEKHGGRIWVTDPEGSGTVFHISLPVHEARVP